MREKPKDKGRLMHMVTAIENINEFLEGKTQHDFVNDKLLYFGVIKNLEIVGEAAYMLTEDFMVAHPETSWKDVRRMRHILVHGYYQIDPMIVWTTIMDDVPVLHRQIMGYLTEDSE